jgi:hypothetical protein
MMNKRFDGVLSRNRKHLARDLALAAFLPVFVLFSGMSVGTQLPALSAAPQPAAVADKADEIDTQVALDESETVTARQGA